MWILAPGNNGSHKSFLTPKHQSAIMPCCHLIDCLKVSNAITVTMRCWKNILTSGVINDRLYTTLLTVVGHLLVDGLK